MSWVFADFLRLLALVALFLCLLAAFPQTGTWRDVAKRFPGCAATGGRVVSWTHVSVGRSGCYCRVVVMPAGLALEPLWPASWVLGSIVIPWSAVTVARRRVFPFLVVTGDPPATLYVQGRVWRQAREHLDRLPSASPPMSDPFQVFRDIRAKVESWDARPPDGASRP